MPYVDRVLDGTTRRSALPMMMMIEMTMMMMMIGMMMTMTTSRSFCAKCEQAIYMHTDTKIQRNELMDTDTSRVTDRYI